MGVVPERNFFPHNHPQVPQIERLRRERHTPVIRLCLKFIAIELAILFNSQILNLSVGGRSRELHNQKTQRTLHTGKQKEQKR
jgi:hypothetical protein